MKTDRQLKEDVEQELRWEPSVRDEQIGVSAKNGVVQLDGQIGSYAEKWAAERAALRVGDVKAIASEIKVILNPSDSRTDEDIAKAAINALEWNSLVPKGTQVKVANGWVTLQGTADWQYERQEAERVVRLLNGVKGVFNDITLKPRVVAADVKDKIQQSLKRNAMIDAGNIQVETLDGTVTLRGKVKSWAEREEAEQAAWSATGVSRVEDLISIA